MPDDAVANYAVGYGRPPRDTQFKRGQSGNPKGRVKGSKNLATVVLAAVNELVTVNENGRRRKITKLEAITKQLTNKAASGETKPTQMLLGLLQWFEARPEAPEKPDVIEDADREIMARLVARLKVGEEG
jgi:hypothetical protein